MYALITSLLVAAVCVYFLFFIEALHPCRPPFDSKGFFPSVRRHPASLLAHTVLESI